MQDKAIEIINILEENGFVSYIVGGYVRDYLLDNESIDIDICTNARPMDIEKLFDIIPSSSMQYGSVTVIYGGSKFDITTFRRDCKYEGNRKPVKVKYISDLKRDLLRRDFTINTLCMNGKGEVMDVLGVKDDLSNRVIKTVGNPKYRIFEDSLRILRAVRFATRLQFDIDDKTKYYMKKYGYLLKRLSYERKKQELDKIFSSPNNELGKELLLELKLDRYLEIPKLSSVVMIDDIIGIWSQLDVMDIYPFTKAQKKQMEIIGKLLSMDIMDRYTIYKYDLYLCTIVAKIKGIDIVNLNQIYSELPIHHRKEIVIKPVEIANILHMDFSSEFKDIMNDIEKRIVMGELENKVDKIRDYVLINYK